MRDRPLSLVRCPRGRHQQCFYQKHLTEALPDAVHGVAVAEKNGSSQYIFIRDVAGLLSLVQFGTLEMHPWPARIDRLDRPDYMVFDLDPDVGVPWSVVTAAAVDLKAALSGLGLEAFVRSSGGKGLHVVAPILRRHGWDELRRFAETLARLMVRQNPLRYVATSSKAKRAGKIFIDYLRNSRGATSIANYSTRALSGAPVAVPLRWEELDSLPGANAFDIRTLQQRLAALPTDPWATFESSRRRLPSLPR